MDSAPASTASVASSRPREAPEAALQHGTDEERRGRVIHFFAVRDPIDSTLHTQDAPSLWVWVTPVSPAKETGEEAKAAKAAEKAAKKKGETKEERQARHAEKKEKKEKKEEEKKAAIKESEA